MTLRECYDSIGSDFDKALVRMCGKESMLAKFVKKFLSDPSYPNLAAAYESGDIATAFRAAHTLKGVCLNLGFDVLEKSASELTEALRDTDSPAPNAAELYERVKHDYDLTLSAVKSIEE